MIWRSCPWGSGPGRSCRRWPGAWGWGSMSTASFKTSPLLQVTSCPAGSAGLRHRPGTHGHPGIRDHAAPRPRRPPDSYHRPPHLGPQAEAGPQPGGGFSSPDRGLSLSLRHQYCQDHRPGETGRGRGRSCPGWSMWRTTCFPARWSPPPGCGRPSRPWGSTGWWWPPAVPGPTKGCSGRSWRRPA